MTEAEKRMEEVLSEQVNYCRVCGELAEDGCRHRLSGKRVSGGYVHEAGAAIEKGKRSAQLKALPQRRAFEVREQLWVVAQQLAKHPE